MANNRIKGITIEIGGDTTGLQKALNKVNSDIRITQSQLTDVQRLLKLDPHNTELLAQKQKLLGQAIHDTADKLKTLKAAAEQSNQALKDGKISLEQYNALKREIIATEQSLKSLENQAKKTNSTVSDIKAFGNKSTAIGRAMAPASALAGGMLAGSLKVAADFEKAMSKVGAITKADTKQLEELSTTARKLGETTQFSATQAAEGMVYLGMAGFKTKQIISAMPAMLALAGAGGTGLAETADIISDDLTAFGMSAEQAGHMADVFAETITNSNTDIRMMGETMKYAAPVAKAFGLTLEETAALTGLMGNSAIKASQAGTSIRSALLRLAGPPKAAATELKKLGISLSDTTAAQYEAAAELDALGIRFDENAQGGSKMAGILQQLRQKFKGMSEEEQVASAKAIFGTNASSAWIAVLNSGEGTFERFVEQLRKADGAAEKLNARMNDNTIGAATQFGSALESLGISIGNVFLPGVTAIIKALTAVVNIINALPGPIKAFIGVIGGIISIAAPLLIIIGQFAMGLGILIDKFPLLASWLSRMPVYISALGNILRGLYSILLANPVTSIVLVIVTAIIYLYNNCETFRSLINDSIEGWKLIFSDAGEAITGIIKSIGDVIAGAFTWGADLCKGIAEGIYSCIGKVRKAVSAVAEAIRSKLHFSRPDEGPLRDYEKWMPDFLSGLARGIRQSRHLVTKEISRVADNMVINPIADINGSGSATINLTQPVTLDGRVLTNIVSKIQLSNTQSSLRNRGGRR